MTDHIDIADLESTDCPALDHFKQLRVVWSGDASGSTGWLDNTPDSRKQLMSIAESIWLEAHQAKKTISTELVGR